MELKKEEFERIADDIYDELPKIFGDKIDNVQIVIEDFPTEEESHDVHASKTTLLGLYQGVPLPYRGTWYGARPTVPDRITLYQKNIESGCTNRGQLIKRIREVLFHELGHYFGMSEAEIRNAMKEIE